MDTYALLSTAVGGLLLFLAIAFFKHKAEISSLSSKIGALEDRKIKLETENRELVQKVTELQSINIEQQAKIAECEKRQSPMGDYPPDKITGFPTNPANGNFLCPVCIQELPPKVMALDEDEKAWWCPKGPEQHFFQWKSQKLS